MIGKRIKRVPRTQCYVKSDWLLDCGDNGYYTTVEVPVGTLITALVITVLNGTMRDGDTKCDVEIVFGYFVYDIAVFGIGTSFYD